MSWASLAPIRPENAGGEAGLPCSLTHGVIVRSLKITVHLVAILLSGCTLFGCSRAIEPLISPGESAVALTGGPNTSMIYLARTSDGVLAVDLGWWGPRPRSSVRSATSALRREAYATSVRHMRDAHRFLASFYATSTAPGSVVKSRSGGSVYGLLPVDGHIRYRLGDPLNTKRHDPCLTAPSSSLAAQGRRASMPRMHFGATAFPSGFLREIQPRR